LIKIFQIFWYGYEIKKICGLLGKAGFTKGYGEKGLTGIGKDSFNCRTICLGLFSTPKEEEEDLDQNYI
jgi:hypothetical protein